jgi:hypothetical protein
MTGFPQVPADRPLPDRDRRRRELIALVRSEQEDDDFVRQPLTARLRLEPRRGADMTDARPDTDHRTDAADAPLEILDTAVRTAWPSSAQGRPRRRSTWMTVAAAVTGVVVLGVIGAAMHGSGSGNGSGSEHVVPAAGGAMGSAEPTLSVPVLNGVSQLTAQNELTACIKAGIAGTLQSGNWTGKPGPVDPVPAYRVVIAKPHLYRAMEDGLSTFLVGTGPSGQLFSCSVPDDPKNPNGREAWLGPRPAKPAGAFTSKVTVEYDQGGVGTPTIDGKGASVYATTLTGHYGEDISRVTVQYPGGKEQDAITDQGVWFDQSLLDSTQSNSTRPPVVRGYAPDGRLVYDSATAAK